MTLPALEITSPFDSRNTMFGVDAFWSLVPLPMPVNTDDYEYDIEEYDKHSEVVKDEYIVRSAIAQAVMSNVAGSTKFNVAQTPTR